MSTQVGNQTLIWGVTDTGTLGYFENLEFEQDGELVEVPDGDGAIQAIIFSGEKLNVKGTFVYDSVSPNVVPQRGTAIALTQTSEDWTETSFYIAKISQAFNNNDVMKVSFEATSYPSIT
jgi:hypothetical protein